MTWSAGICMQLTQAPLLRYPSLQVFTVSGGSQLHRAPRTGLTLWRSYGIDVSELDSCLHIASVLISAELLSDQAWLLCLCVSLVSSLQRAVVLLPAWLACGVECAVWCISSFNVSACVGKWTANGANGLAFQASCRGVTYPVVKLTWRFIISAWEYRLSTCNIFINHHQAFSSPVNWSTGLLQARSSSALACASSDAGSNTWYDCKPSHLAVPDVLKNSTRVSPPEGPLIKFSNFKSFTLLTCVRPYPPAAAVALLVSWILLIPSLPIGIRHWLYTLGSATFLGAVFDAMGEVTRLLTGILAAPAFDKPWLVGVQPSGFTFKNWVKENSDPPSWSQIW